MSTDVIAAELENAGLSLEVVTWRDSNHECVFFNNQTGSVNFLGTDSNLLRRNIHPVLLKHLQSNKIVVGEDLQNLEDTSKYWDVLANVTGVRRSQEEVNQVCGCIYKLRIIIFVISIILCVFVSLLLCFFRCSTTRFV